MVIQIGCKVLSGHRETFRQTVQISNILSSHTRALPHLARLKGNIRISHSMTATRTSDCIIRGMSKKIRYAVVGLGHIAQVAVLPAFAHAARNSTLAALVSGDRTKLRELSRRDRE